MDVSHDLASLVSLLNSADDLNLTYLLILDDEKRARILFLESIAGVPGMVAAMRKSFK